MTKIKFCGLRRPEDAAHAESLGATYGGVILTESPRRVTALEARDVFDAAPLLKRVGVVSREPISRIIHAAHAASLDVLQLHGHFSPDEHAQLRDEFDGEIWSVIAIDAQSGVPSQDWKAVADLADALMLDTGMKGRSGGSGKSFDWKKAAALVHGISRELPVVLAGGLNEKNVRAAIEILRPSVVDVSSGVETSPGVKSAARMTSFARSVLSASIV